MSLSATAAVRVFDAERCEHQLHSRVGEGGEGKVFHFSGNPDLVVKVHHAEDVDDRQRREIKLRAIISKGSERLRGAAAWPQDLVYDEKGKVTGFTMEFLSGYMPLFTAYQPKTRLRKLPGKTFAYLVRIAKNLAACVHFVHEDDMVIGDLNETNVLITPGAMVKLIDVDSFQITVDGQVFPPNVGKPELLAPELQGRGLDGRTRRPIEDCFSLAILIFQILNLGRHPFAGRPDDDNIELSLETAIEKGWYVFTSRKHVPIKRPPGLALDHLPPHILELFEEAFDLEGLRPTADMWHAALDALEKSLDECPDNPQHVFWTGSRTCPWCSLESTWNVPLFLSEAPRVSELDAFDFDALWGRVEGFQAKGLHDSLPLPSNYLGKSIETWPLQKLFSKLSWKTLASWWFVHYFAVQVILQTASSSSPYLVAFAALVVAAYAVLVLGLLSMTIAKGWHALRAKPLERKYRKVADQWRISADKDLLAKKVAEFREVKERLEELPTRHQEMRAAELRQMYRPQLDSFLGRYSLIVADVHPDQRGQLENLVDRGMKTAADVSRAKLVSMLPAKSPLIDQILYWVAMLENQFWQSSNLSLGTLREATLANTTRTMQKDLQKRLACAESELESLADQIKNNQASVLAIYEQFAPEYAERLAVIESFGPKPEPEQAQQQQQTVP